MLLRVLACALLLGCADAPGAAPRAQELGGPAAPTAPVPGGDEGAVGELPALDAPSRAALANAPVPVLLLPGIAYADQQVMSGPRWAAVAWRSGEGEGALTLSLHATDVVHGRLDPDEEQALPAPTHVVRGRPARWTINEGIGALSWTEAGVAYALEAECFDPHDDPRCAEPGFLLALAASLQETP
ncbi:MAG TPA: hypothetical protein RMH85_15425 [Polyangiaceae bacterium LLY-WYZ-15_(1-7)]|nr:hypothetical protein [Sandaracinus sp.]HJK91254.1 hypothetical protein [Polyangiaceae bacterium LLY-WYZ-15_(1-7)]MBJ71498.1 hypothetical protein [Sandaracinus sp.]HJL03654.1 hypothetical protein [Polyangiaceae bacterium LLY-WYZ-15_(1-7)]HJL09890.1 hypothetical protein [Polyangiaceae bacterium LLY-WYZ-15_(1-7)]